MEHTGSALQARAEGVETLRTKFSVRLAYFCALCERFVFNATNMVNCTSAPELAFLTFRGGVKYALSVMR